MPRSRLLLAVVAAFAIAMPAAAQVDASHHFVDVEINTRTINRCNGEVVQLTGTCRSQILRWTYPDGSLRGDARTSCHLDGIGSFGNRYVSNETYFARGEVPAVCTPEDYPSDRTGERTLLVSQTSADNYWVRLYFTFLHPNCFEGPPTVIVDAETECRG